MSYGVASSDAHLDLTGAAPKPEEIDWPGFLNWNGGKSPTFAGRSFLGGSYVWAHGEGAQALSSVNGLKRIAPIQLSNPDRQEATGFDGFVYGNEDASALAGYLETCLGLGELTLAGDFAYVYLEVEEGVQLSADYWSAWCTVHFDYMFVKEVQLQGGVSVPNIVMPFLPCILCSFPNDAGTGKYTLDGGVKQALDKAGAGGAASRCYGFWARASDEPTYHAPEPQLDWTRFAPYQQPLGKATQDVPIQLWRYKDPDQPVAQVDPLTLDATRVSGQSDPAYDGMLDIKPAWKRGNQGKPNTFGIGKGGDLRREITCIAGNQLTISHTPDIDPAEAPQGPAQNPPLKGRPSFALRYYSTERTATHKQRKDISADEARALARRRVSVVATWQGAVPYQGVPAYLATPGSGREDARNAFSYAANWIGQPPWTPVYFAVDTDVKTAPANPATAATPAQVESYFDEIKQGYLDYIGDQVSDGLPAVPYYTGIYSASSVLEMCYVKGLATHFWQAWPPSWGEGGANPARPNLAPFTHANGWQVSGSNSPGFATAGAEPCRQTSVWFVAVKGVTSGTYKLEVAGAKTAPIQFDAHGPAVAAALAPLAAIGQGNIVGSDTQAAGWQRVVTLNIEKKVVLTLDDSGLVFGDPNGAAGTQYAGNYLDLEVGWGDVGGWTLR